MYTEFLSGEKGGGNFKNHVEPIVALAYNVIVIF